MSKLRLRLEGDEITLRTFVRIMRGSLDILSRVDIAITREEKGTIEWVIRQLWSESPITADLETRVKREGFDYAPKLVATNVIDALDAIEHEPVIPPYFSEFTLNKVGSISKNLKAGEATAFRVMNLDEKTEVVLTEQAGVNARKALKPVSKGIGSVTGTLEVMSLRGRPHVNIYDALTHSAVKCALAEEDLHRIKESFGTRVTATGIVHRNLQGTAVRMEKTEIRPLPPEDALPRARELQGIAPDFTGDMTTEKYLRELRDG